MEEVAKNSELRNRRNLNIPTILASDSFRRLLRGRNRIRYFLSCLVIAIHAFFIGGIAFYNEWFAQPYKEDSIIPNGIIFTVLVILAMLALEFIYIFVSDNKLENIQKQVITEVLSDESR